MGKKFKDYKKNEVPLTKEEKRYLRENKGTWGGGSFAVWKSQNPKTGEVTYITHTHRAFNTAPTIKGAVGRFNNFIKSTASERYFDEKLEKLAALKADVKLTPLQQRVVDKDNDSLIIGHPVGSGKTLSGIAKFEKSRKKGKGSKALVVVPSGLRDNFAAEGVKKFTDSTYNIIGNKSEIKKKTHGNVNPDSDYNIISYEMFRKDPERYIRESGADTLIADEYHRLRNTGTSTGNSFKNTRNLYKNFIGLTGSVVNNGVADVMPLVDIASSGNHDLGNSKREFDKNFLRRDNSKAYKYVKENKRPVIGLNNEKQLKNTLSKYVDYADIDDVRDIADIPKKEIETKKIPINKEQMRLYKGIINENKNVRNLIYNKRLETMGDEDIAKAFNDLIEARKLMNSIGAIKPGISDTESSRITPKAKQILDDLDNHLRTTPDGQGILLTNLIRGGADVLEAGLKDRGIPYGKFIGKGNKDVTEESRQKAVKDFKNRKNRAMIISGAGAEGLSLNDTTWEGLFDPHYNPERMNQMEARGIRSQGLMHRPKEERKVHVNRYMSTIPKTLGVFKSGLRTPDEMIYDIAGRKDEQNQMLYDLMKK